jgi:hypothetical protein
VHASLKCGNSFCFGLADMKFPNRIAMPTMQMAETLSTAAASDCLMGAKVGSTDGDRFLFLRAWACVYREPFAMVLAVIIAWLAVQIPLASLVGRCIKLGMDEPATRAAVF